MLKNTLRHLLPALAAFCAWSLGPTALSAKPEKWTGPDGKTFSAEPSEIIGPFAIFGGSGVAARRVPLHLLSEADAIRFATGLEKKPARQTDWSLSKSTIALDLKEVEFVSDKKLVPFDRKGKLEPMLYVVLYASSGVGESWGFVGESGAKYKELKAAYPGQIEFIMAGLRHSRADQTKMMVDMGVPFLSLDTSAVASSYAIAKTSGSPPFAVLLTRDGSALRGAQNKEELGKLLYDAEELLRFMQLNDTRGWKSRQTYYQIVQKVLHAKDAAPPLLIGDPLDHGKLKQLGVQGFTATLKVAAGGAVSEVQLQPGAKIPEKLAPQVVAALKQTLLIPAVNQGVYVEGEYTYAFGTP